MTGIIISNIWEDEDMIEFSIKISNGSIACEMEFYQNDNAFLKFANELLDFPQNLDHKVIYQDGNWKNSGYILEFEAFCYEPNGKSVLKVSAKSESTIPLYFESIFYIFCFPAKLNELGQNLKRWKPRTEKKFEWLLSDE